MMQPMQGAQMEFKAGTLIFSEGDPGGDLYFIREGEVEVYREVNGRRIGLATLKPGEVLGIMTCLTREPRLASARAATDLKCLVVKQAGIKSLITTTPPWVNTVIKDMILRVKHMDECYSRAMQQLSEMTDHVSSVRRASMLARGLAEIGSIQTEQVKSGEPRIVDVDLAIDHLARIVGCGNAALEAIFAVFVEVGLLKADPGSTKRYAELGVLARLSAYAELCERISGNDAMRQALAAMDERDTGFLLSFAATLKKLNVNLHDQAHQPVSKLVTAEFPLEFASQSLPKAVAAGFLTLSNGQDGDSTVSFVPSALISGVRSLFAYRKLRALDEQETEARLTKLQEKATVAAEAF